MLKVKWEYFFNHIGTNKAVAILKKEDGTSILEVYEDTDCHFSKPCSQFAFLLPKKVPFSLEHNIMRKHDSELKEASATAILCKRLDIACELIAENFFQQLNNPNHL